MARELVIGGENVADMVEKHAAFWRHTDGGAVLRYTGIYSQSSAISLPQPGGGEITETELLEPQMVSPDDLIKVVESYDHDQLDAALALNGEYLVNVGQGDFLPLAMPLMKFPWLEAIFGCPIRMTEGQIWDAKFPGDPEEVVSDKSSFDHNPWFQLYLEFLKVLQNRLSGRFFVSTSSNQRGASDLVAAVLGVQEAIFGWLDNPDIMSRMLRRCTDAILALVEASNSIIESSENGYACKWGLWSPEKIVATQEDHSSLLSPEIYKEQILPYDREVFRSSPKSIIHLHNNGLHQVPALVDIPELDAIQVWIDPYPDGDRKEYEITMLQQIMERKPLILDVYLPSLEEGDRLLEQLPQRGLFYKLWVDPAVYDSLPDDYPGTDLWLRG
jgi:hypothetical protein